MENLTLHVTTSPFNEEQVNKINELLVSITDYQKIWLTGYLSASNAAQIIRSESEAPTITPELEKKEPQAATILYGSQTGNAQGVAEKLAAKLKEHSVDTTVSSMSSFKTNILKSEEEVFYIGYASQLSTEVLDFAVE